MSETGDGLRAQAQRVIGWTLATWALGRIFDGFEARLTEALREEDEMANESEARSCIGCECEGDGCSACEAEKPHECNADSEVELEPCGVCTGCGCPSRCEEAPEAAEESHECNAACEALLPHPDLPVPTERCDTQQRINGDDLRCGRTKGHVGAHEDFVRNVRWMVNSRPTARKAAVSPVCATTPTWELYNELQFRLTQVEAERDEARAEVESLRKERDNALTLAKNWQRQAAEQFPGHKADLKLLAERGERIRRLGDETIPELQRALNNERVRYNKLQEMHTAAGERWIDWQSKADEFREERDIARRENTQLQQTIEEWKKKHEKAMERLRAEMRKVATKGTPSAPEQPDLPNLIERLETLEQFMRDVKNGRTW